MLCRAVRRALFSATALGVTGPVKPLSRGNAASFAITSRGYASDRELFPYTSGRYLFNEKLRLKERYVAFNVDALKAAAEQHVGHGRVSGLCKLAEGGFNRVFLLTMEDGYEAIAKIPYSIAVPKHYTTASEVATMSLLRSKGVPVPTVFGWSSKASANPVGVEYIIMEKAPGIGLDTRWFEIGQGQRHPLVTSFVDMETKIFALPFGCFGSLYFKEDVPAHLQGQLYGSGVDDAYGDAQKYCIGPIADYMFWRGARTEMRLHCGPWQDHREYLLSIGQREAEWTRRFGRPIEESWPHNSVVQGKRSPDEYLALLDRYHSIAPHLMPGHSQSALNRPTMRHPDLTPSNVFVSSESHKISSIIDWQFTVVSPLLLVAGYPGLFENPDPLPPKGLGKPVLPADYESLRLEDKSEADELHRRRVLYYLYRVFNGAMNKPHLKCLQQPLYKIRQHLVDRADRQWSGNLITLKGALIRIVENWDTLQGASPSNTDCPVSFSKSEIEGHYKMEEEWVRMNGIVEDLRSALRDVSEDGWLRTEVYDDVVATNQALKADFIQNCEGDEEMIRMVEEHWPFQDHEEFS